MFLAQRVINETCRPLTNIISNKPKTSTLQPKCGFSQDPSAYPARAHRNTVNSVFVMEACGEVVTGSGQGLGGKAVTGAPHGFNMHVMAGRFKCFAQAADMHVNRSFFNKHVVAPNLIKQLGP